MTRSDGDPLPSHLYTRGLLEGKYSDINLTVFGTTYHLHRLVLDRAPFFASALSPPWLEATAKDVTLHPEEIDSNISETAFKLALRRLYGHPDLAAEAQEAYSLFATASWLEMTELVSVSVEHLLRQMQLSTISSMIKMVTVNYYGKAGERILHAAKAMLSRDGFEMPLKYWDDISSEVICDVVGGDSFWCQTEWQRWELARRILNRRLKLVARETDFEDALSSTSRAPFTNRAQLDDLNIRSGKSPVRAPTDSTEAWSNIYRHSDIEPIFDLLEYGIYYMHFDFEQLQHVRSAKDIFGVVLVSETIINDALWIGLELRQKILNSREADDELGFSQCCAQQSRSPASNATTPVGLPIMSKGLLEVSQDDARQSQLTPVKPSTQHFSSSDGTKQYWIPSVDCNIVTGGIEPVITLSTSVSDRAAAKEKSRHVPVNEEPRPTNFTTYPPFRFSCDFPNPRAFKPGKRIYSPTIFYAGSSWNVYLQRNKNTGSRSSQLGVYLHRAEEHPQEEDHWSSSGPSVDDRIGDLERQLHRLEGRRMQLRRARESIHASPSVTMDTSATNTQDQRMPSVVTDHTGLSSFMTTTTRKTPDIRTSLFLSAPSDISNDADESASADESAYEGGFPAVLPHSKGTLGTYIDARPVIKAYFKIFSPSRDGRMLSVYESAPDEFSFGQSWGWRSSSFFTDENEWLVDELDGGEDRLWQEEGRFETDVEEDGTATTGLGNGRKGTGVGLAGGRLRFMVCLGLV